MDHLLTFVILAVFFLFYWVYYTSQRKHLPTTSWEQLPTKADYLTAHPESVDGDIIFCYHCGHHELLEVGMVHLTDFRREWVCAKCKQGLATPSERCTSPAGIRTANPCWPPATAATRSPPRQIAPRLSQAHRPPPQEPHSGWQIRSTPAPAHSP